MKTIYKIIEKLNRHGLVYIPDRLYIKLMYRYKLGKKLNLKEPLSFNEKMQWLKLYDRKPIYTKMADKYGAKEFVSEKIGKKYVNPTIGVFNGFEEINFETLPKQFVIKCTHDSGGLVICRDKECFDAKKTKKKIEACLKSNYYLKSREWPYKNINPRIIIEKYIEDNDSEDLKDYKFMCFNGKVKYIYVTVKNDNIYENYYDRDFNIVNINHGFPRNKKEFKKPDKLNEMIRAAEILSKNTYFLRVDFHYVNDKIIFGEMTFYDWGGFKQFSNNKTDLMLGKMISLE